MEQYKVDFESMGWEVPEVGVRFKVYQREGRQLRLVEFAKGFELDWCSEGHVGYVLEGELEIDFDGKKEVFRAGDGMFIPAGEGHKHKGRAVTDTVKLVLVEDA